MYKLEISSFIISISIVMQFCLGDLLHRHRLVNSRRNSGVRRPTNLEQSRYIFLYYRREAHSTYHFYQLRYNVGSYVDWILCFARWNQNYRAATDTETNNHIQERHLKATFVHGLNSRKIFSKGYETFFTLFTSTHEIRR